MGPRRTPLSVPVHDAASCTVDVRRHALAHVPFFAGLDEAGLDDVERRCTVHDHAAGTAVMHAGEPARRIFVVAAGTAKVVRTALDGTEVLIDVARPGDFIGTLPLLGAETYPDSVWALTPLCVLGLDEAAFGEILDSHPSVARLGLGVMARRLEQAHRHIHALGAADSEQRVAAALAMLEGRVGVRRRDGILLDLPLSRDDLAGLTGTASETVSRILARLGRDGVIETGRRWIRIVDSPALHDLAQI
ncbi:Crp/Fnr family transcriptional regulator [Actinomarinicola tropica]|uniref:Helix-turn-helix domain-containing protein n=1 Tax=Actinomarinicola tropica TaxID=2789776 RepID=A0A5Q2RMH2_9ACTN|nr:Crp/Fnr family transcriptional regulator [Actinomarinicola tropica]QGG94385.1 helix-turn-helix domain-containing protein [Actinomarinicola tropica]